MIAARPRTLWPSPVCHRTGVGEEIGVYDTLLAYLLPGLSEDGVIEYRFSQADPATYKHLITRYGHTAIGGSRYTTSAFLGGALGHLWREGSVTGTLGPGHWLLVLQPDRRHLRPRRHADRGTHPQLGDLRLGHPWHGRGHLAAAQLVS